MEPGLDHAGLVTALNGLDVVLAPAMTAHVFIVRDPLQCADVLMLWACMLRGGWLVSEDVTAVCIKLRPAIAVRRRVWLSDRFQQQHPHLLRLLQAACTWPNSKLTLLPDQDTFVQVKCVASNLKSPTVGALLAADELQGDSVMARVPHCFCVNTFGRLLYVQDVYKGIC